MLTRTKIDRLQRMMAPDFDAVLCRLPVNVNALLSYWPGNHSVAAVVPAQGRPALVVPATEYENCVKETDAALVDVVPYDLESTTELIGATDAMLRGALQQVFKTMGLESARVGLELSFEDGASARMFGDYKYPGKPTFTALAAAFPAAAAWPDATALISRFRWVKDEGDMVSIRKAIDIALMGYAAAGEALRPGMTEADLAAEMEGTMMRQGTGRNGAAYTRAFASVYSGPRTATQWAHWACTTGRTIEEGDSIIIELGAVTDGFWCDLTRCYVAGTPSQKQSTILEHCKEAQRHGIEAARPGRPIADIDNACHRYFESQGFGVEAYRHQSGHGCGYNYHEGPPVHAAATDIILEPGMVLCVEPGLYFPGEFGIRCEDMIRITEAGCEVLSGSDHHF